MVEPLRGLGKIPAYQGCRFCFNLYLYPKISALKFPVISKDRYVRLWFPGILILLFFFRLVFGLCSEFWFEDEIQVYLIGLKYYTTGHFPLFGPDVVYTQSQIPGSLQGLLVGGPFFIWPGPEAPYILLNILSFSSLCLLAAYILKRLPAIPAWFAYTWLLTCPWTMNYSTHVINPSYVLPAAIVFFIAFFEVVPRLRSGFLKYSTAMFAMGFCFFWIFQLHKSWVLLLPFMMISAWYAWKVKKNLALYFLAGCLVTGSLLLPVVMAYGIHSGAGGSSGIVFNPANAGQFITVLTRYLSFAAYEIPRFLGPGLRGLIEFISIYYLSAPFVIFVTLIGFAQPVYLVAAFLIRNPAPLFRQVRMLTLLTFILVFLSFFFSVKGPSSHTFYLVFPLVMIYSFYCWAPLFKNRWFSRLMAMMLVSGIVVHAAIALRNYETKSMYLEREKPSKAILEKNYHLLGERRSYDRNP